MTTIGICGACRAAIGTTGHECLATMEFHRVAAKGGHMSTWGLAVYYMLKGGATPEMATELGELLATQPRKENNFLVRIPHEHNTVGTYGNKVTKRG